MATTWEAPQFTSPESPSPVPSRQADIPVIEQSILGWRLSVHPQESVEYSHSQVGHPWVGGEVPARREQE